MKTITELQTELQEAAAQLETISGELAALQQPKEKQEVDFRHIEIVGQRYPMSTHHMKGQPQKFQKHYFAVLSNCFYWSAITRKTAGCLCSVCLQLRVVRFR